MRKLIASASAFLMLLCLGLWLGGYATAAVPTPNTPCYITQGGDYIVAANGCTISTEDGVLLIASGANPPATCSTGQLFLDTDETSDSFCTTISDNTLCKCVATDTWVGDMNVVIQSGTAPPTTCTVGQLFLDTDETLDTRCTTTDDNSLCACVATDTWSSTE